MEEIWKSIPGYEELYEVSNYGNVKSYHRKNVITLIKVTDKIGYLYVGLKKNKISKCFKIHQLVSMAFLNHIPNKHKIVVNHKDFDKKNNMLENLELVTQRENCIFIRNYKTSKYVGVSWHKKANKWIANINTKNKQNYLGLFESEIDAHLAYEKALSEITTI